MAEESNGSGLRVVLALAAIAGLVASLIAITQPIRKDVETLSAIVQMTRKDLRRDLREHERGDGHSDTTAALAALNQKFAEVETQFKWRADTANIRMTALEKERDKLLKWIDRHGRKHTDLEATVRAQNAEQDTRLSNLEQGGCKPPR